MKNTILLVCGVVVVVLLTVMLYNNNNVEVKNNITNEAVIAATSKASPQQNKEDTGDVEGATVVATTNTEQTANIQTAQFANGCFWCVEADLQKVSGVVAVVSGYADGTNENPTYENYGENGHREVVLVTYDATVVSYGNLVEHILKHGDVTDPNGSFGDRGAEYAPALYYSTETEKNIAERIVASVENATVYDGAITIEIIPTAKFWNAEDYHQNYAEKNPIKYFYYRTASGRTAFIETYWGERAEIFEFS